MDGRNRNSNFVVWYVVPHNSCYVYIIIFKRNKIMSMELHTLRAVKVTKNIFELHRVNTELQHLKICVKVLENRKIELENSF